MEGNRKAVKHRGFVTKLHRRSTHFLCYNTNFRDFLNEFCPSQNPILQMINWSQKMHHPAILIEPRGMCYIMQFMTHIPWKNLWIITIWSLTKKILKNYAQCDTVPCTYDYSKHSLKLALNDWHKKNNWGNPFYWECKILTWKRKPAFSNEKLN